MPAGGDLGEWGGKNAAGCVSRVCANRWVSGEWVGVRPVDVLNGELDFFRPSALSRISHSIAEIYP